MLKGHINMLRVEVLGLSFLAQLPNIKVGFQMGRTNSPCSHQ